MLIDRRTLLLGALALGAAACTSSTDQGSGGDAPIGTVGLGGGGGDGGTDVESPSNPDRSKVPTSIAMVGDSITVLSQDTLKAVLGEVGFGSITINAEVSRRIEVGDKQPMPGLDVIKFIAATAPAPKMWVVALGTNDAGLYASDDEYQGLIDDVLEVIPEDLPLVWVTTYRDDHVDACERFNLLMRKSLGDRGNATVGEWYQQVTKSKGKILTKDGVHPNAEGILVFADTVRAAIAIELS